MYLRRQVTLAFTADDVKMTSVYANKTLRKEPSGSCW